MRASGYEREDGDFYVEPAWVVHQLLDKERFPGVVWDPAAGSGTIPQAVIARGGVALATDIHPNCAPCGQLDFFTAARSAHDQPNHIISNPPYSDLEAFIRHALTLVDGKVAVIARLGFLGSQKRRAFFRSTPLARVRVCSRRPSMPPGNRPDLKAKGGSIEYAWFVFDPSVECGTTILSFLD